jgi:thymidylate synthase
MMLQTKRTIALGEGFFAEIDQINKHAWSEQLMHFSDATIYQTWSYGGIRWGENCLSHLVVKAGDEIVGLAQVAIKKLPILDAGIAYVPWGPIWSRKRGGKHNDVIQKVLCALKQEYCLRRGLLLRIAPQEIEKDAEPICSYLTAEGYVYRSKPYQTLIIDLSNNTEDLYKKTSRRWHRALKTATAEGLTVIEDRQEDSFKILGAIYDQMVSRKGFIPGVNIHEFSKVQADLPQTLKLKVLICKHNHKPIAALAASLIGEKGIGLLGATSTEGLNLGGFHLLNWKMMEWMKQAGARYYDFGGYDPKRNPGTARFKDGLPGEVICHIGQYEACSNLLSRIAVGGGESIKFGVRYGRQAINKIHKWGRIDSLNATASAGTEYETAHARD